MSSNKREKGAYFERLMKKYLMTDPQYSDRLSDVWLWSDLMKGQDLGIDLVAREKSSGEYWSIQCKFYSPDTSLQKKDVSEFIADSQRKHETRKGERISFKQSLFVSTTNKWSPNAEKAIEGLEGFLRLSLTDLDEAPIDWSECDLSDIDNTITLEKPRQLRSHQREALDAVKKGLAEHSRGKLIMACGTGKTFTALRLVEEFTPLNGKILFLAPSISLVSQSLRKWTTHRLDPFDALVVCSDSKVKVKRRNEEDTKLYDLSFPATTDADQLAMQANQVDNDRRTILFSTYQSIQVVGDAQKRGAFGDFDLIICDEAHRTVGQIKDFKEEGEDDSAFLKVHKDEFVKAKKRLYMTATPRFFKEGSESKAKGEGVTLYSMNDQKTYGVDLYKLEFDQAIKRNLLVDYKVLIFVVSQEKMESIKRGEMEDGKLIDVELVSKIIGSWKGLRKKGAILASQDGDHKDLTEDTSPVRRAVAFSSTIEASKQITKIFPRVIESYQDGSDASDHFRCSLKHVDGTSNALERQEALKWLEEETHQESECRILSNARCLSEGIDVPSLDAVIFFDTRESVIDIVQSVGRVMRRDDQNQKKYGYIILPVGVPFKELSEHDHYIEKNSRFKGIWKVLKALRAHDKSLVDKSEYTKKVQVLVEGGDGKSKEWAKSDFETSKLPIGEIGKAIYTAIPKKLGDLEYWSTWAEDAAEIANRLTSYIERAIKREKGVKEEFESFLEELQKTLNPRITDKEVIEMLSQHILTRPVFRALFADNNFAEKNAISRWLDSVIDRFDQAAINHETKKLGTFYESVKERVELAKSPEAKQDLIRNLYETFFCKAFPKRAEALGIVYTPIEAVDFILKSVQGMLKKHFNSDLGDKDLHILDPFSGTGTFLVRLIQSDLISDKDLKRKFTKELHANEIVLLAYYIAAINIENAFSARTPNPNKTYEPFEGMVLTDTFQMHEDADLVDLSMFPENNERVKRQKSQPIRVIVGNPPYSSGQKSANDNNKNLDYPRLDSEIRETYAKQSTSTSKRTLYDSYVRAIRWASDRIDQKGIVAFITSSSFLNDNSKDGLRKCLAEEFSHLYLFDLRGDQRTSGEDSRREGGKIFGSGSRQPVVISLMIKDPNHSDPCEIYYHDIGDYLSRKEKLSKIEGFVSMGQIKEWKRIIPNSYGDWIDQRDPAFKKLMLLGDKKGKERSCFNLYSLGVSTSRDWWCTNFSGDELEQNMRKMIDNYNQQRIDYHAQETRPNLESFLDYNPQKINWSHTLIDHLKRNRELTFRQKGQTLSLYRPYTKKWVYFDRNLNESVYQQPKLFPTPNHSNLVICCSGKGSKNSFSCLISRELPSYDCIEKSQGFPLYWYEKQKQADDLFKGEDQPEFVRRDAISDWALARFQEYYTDFSITKVDLFWYIYGVLHSPDYRERFEVNLKKEMVRIPYASDFWLFREAGHKLGTLHLNYETVEPYPLTEEGKKEPDEKGDYRVSKMKFGKKGKEKDKSEILYPVFRTSWFGINIFEYTSQYINDLKVKISHVSEDGFQLACGFVIDHVYSFKHLIDPSYRGTCCLLAHLIG